MIVFLLNMIFAVLVAKLGLRLATSLSKNAEREAEGLQSAASSTVKYSRSRATAAGVENDKSQLLVTSGLDFETNGKSNLSILSVPSVQECSVQSLRPQSDTLSTTSTVPSTPNMVPTMLQKDNMFQESSDFETNEGHDGDADSSWVLRAMYIRTLGAFALISVSVMCRGLSLGYRPLCLIFSHTSCEVNYPALTAICCLVIPDSILVTLMLIMMWNRPVLQKVSCTDDLQERNNLFRALLADSALPSPARLYSSPGGSFDGTKGVLTKGSSFLSSRLSRMRSQQSASSGTDNSTTFSLSPRSGTDREKAGSGSSAEPMPSIEKFVGLLGEKFTMIHRIDIENTQLYTSPSVGARKKTSSSVDWPQNTGGADFADSTRAHASEDWTGSLEGMDLTSALALARYESKNSVEVSVSKEDLGDFIHGTRSSIAEREGSFNLDRELAAVAKSQQSPPGPGPRQTIPGPLPRPTCQNSPKATKRFFFSRGRREAPGVRNKSDSAGSMASRTLSRIGVGKGTNKNVLMVDTPISSNEDQSDVAHDGGERFLEVEECIWASPFAFDVPAQLLRILLNHRKIELQRFESRWHVHMSFSGGTHSGVAGLLCSLQEQRDQREIQNWVSKQVFDMKAHIQWLDKLSKVKEGDAPQELHFKPSKSKKDKLLAAVPLNLQIYALKEVNASHENATSDNSGGNPTNISPEHKRFPIITFGSASAHPLGFKEGGVRALRVERAVWFERLMSFNSASRSGALVAPDHVSGLGDITRTGSGRPPSRSLISMRWNATLKKARLPAASDQQDESVSGDFPRGQSAGGERARVGSQGIAELSHDVLESSSSIAKAVLDEGTLQMGALLGVSSRRSKSGLYYTQQHPPRSKSTTENISSSNGTPRLQGHKSDPNPGKKGNESLDSSSVEDGPASAEQGTLSSGAPLSTLSTLNSAKSIFSGSPLFNTKSKTAKTAAKGNVGEESFGLFNVDGRDDGIEGTGQPAGSGDGDNLVGVNVDVEIKQHHGQSQSGPVALSQMDMPPTLKMADRQASTGHVYRRSEGQAIQDVSTSHLPGLLNPKHLQDRLSGSPSLQTAKVGMTDSEHFMFAQQV
jgi:hypothetical protein